MASFVIQRTCIDLQLVPDLKLARALCLQARSQAIEAQLARTVSELRDLKSRHQQLELMLEQAHQSSQDQLSHSSSETEVL